MSTSLTGSNSLNNKKSNLKKYNKKSSIKKFFLFTEAFTATFQ